MSGVSLADQIKAVEREIGMRRRIYPYRVSTNKMTQAEADKESDAMKAVLESLHRLQSLEK